MRSIQSATLRPSPASAGTDITDLLQRAEHRDACAVDVLMSNVYESLRQLAHRQRAREPAHTLQTTALVHETYLVLMNRNALAFGDRAHFYAYASQVMRHILVDHARRRHALKRQAPPDFTLQHDQTHVDSVIDVLALDEALDQLATVDARLARVAELRLFADLGTRAVAELLQVNQRTVERDWLKARTFLSGCLQLSP
jgi:RNA polymerase sigma factor (TIGR02999 family)